ncbi:ATP synthase mitochondrial F1 complex assembly factor 1 [Cimex lectularius]|uniref:ATP synthase mitochondrial F1 complex assembly factor 1 n=1 Tax=Cimex lectularius TaxID=79782 RepID=A0A8I6RJK5_CIMLE|nr:ATP synthase mitochondrial F1 complex assembly factor 1 [Cimex lectularius]
MLSVKVVGSLSRTELMAQSGKLFRFNNLIRNRRRIMTSPFSLAKAEDDLEKNPFFEKYASKIQKLRVTDPHVFEQKLKEFEGRKKQLKEKLKPPNLQKNVEESKAKEKKGYKNKTLDSIMNVDKLKGKSKEEVDHIWKEYYKSKEDVVFATMSKELYNKFASKCKECPTFVVPLPRGEGYEFFMSQYEDNGLHFASLAQYKLHKESCPECLCLTYFPELPQDIVLMLGEYDNKILSSLEASCIVNVVQYFYGSDDKYQIVKHFNKDPKTFDYNVLITAMGNMSLNEK